MRKRLVLFLFVGVILMIGRVNAVSWNSSAYGVSYHGSEDVQYIHNLISNVTSYEEGTLFSISTQAEHPVTWINRLGQQISFNYPNTISSWVWIIDPIIGNLKINSIRDNQTGAFVLPMVVTKGGASMRYFNFTINATNDAPTFVNLLSVYNTSVLTSGSSSSSFSFSGLDEELHYPLFIENITIFEDCSKASWTNQSNCSLGNHTFSRIGNTSLLTNFTNLTRENVGRYNLSVCIRDTLPSNEFLPVYRTISQYDNNQTRCQNFSINIFYSLGIDASNCSGLNLAERDDLVCHVNITTRLPTQSFSMNSVSSLSNSNFIASLIGLNWFYPIKTNISEGYAFSIPINFTNLTKRNVGNWKINLTVNDSDGARVSELIYFNVSRGANAVPVFSFNFNGTNNRTSINVPTKFQLNMSDEDFLIPDKLVYNETVNLTMQIFNRNTFEIVHWPEFTNKIFYFDGGNSSIVYREIVFTPNISQAGNWTANFSYFDKENSSSNVLFNFTIENNTPPVWNQTSYLFNCVVNFNQETTSICLNNFNLTSGFVSDVENDSLTFSLIGTSNINYSSNFNLSFNRSSGIINFTPWKQDVSQYLPGGIWNFSIVVSDGFFNIPTRFMLNITNINSPPRIENLTFPSSTFEGELAIIQFRVHDFDYLIPLPSQPPYVERIYSVQSRVINYTSSNLSLNPFIYGNLVSNYYPVNITFTPVKSNVGNFTFNISVRDYYNLTNWTIFNITVLEVNNAPSFVRNLTNQSSAVGRQFTYKINATDIEDGSNLTFSYSMIPGIYFGRALKNDLIFDETAFNSSTGLFNMTFNESHAGAYRINISVRDNGLKENSSANLTSSQIFWLFVYDEPTIYFPLDGQEFHELKENETFIFNVRVNHSVGNNLNYAIFFGEFLLRDSFVGFGNYTNISWSFTPNFTDETYGLFKNLTIFVYPSDLFLSESFLINSSVNIKVNISHTNHPLKVKSSFPSSFPPTNNDQTIVLDLSNYFLDYDSLDPFHNQIINFSVQSREVPTLISSSFNGWNLTLQLSSAVFGKILRTENLNITAYEINLTDNSTIRNVTNNNFEVRFIEPTVVERDRPSSGGGGSSTIITRHTSLLISVPSAVQAGFGDRIQVPISIKNNGEVAISGISLSGLIKLGEKNIQDVSMSLSKNLIQSLEVGASEELMAHVNIDTTKAGRYLGIIYANVTNPRFNQEGQFYIEIEVIPSQNVEEVLVFTEKLIVGNPECIELRARLDEARKLNEEGRLEEATRLSEELIDSCKKSISQRKRFSLLQKDVSKALIYLFSGLIGVFLFILIFYVYKRVKLNKVMRDEYI